MQESMKSGFMDATGVDPAQMKIMLSTLVVAIIFLIGAWFGKQVLEAYGQGELDSNEAIRTLLSVVIIIFLALGFVSIF